MSRFCPFSPLFMIKEWISISQKPLLYLALISRSAPNWEPLFAGSRLGLDPHLIASVSFGAERVMGPIRSRYCIGTRPPRLGTVPVRCRTGGGSNSGPNELWPPLPCRGRAPHSLTNVFWFTFGLEWALAPSALWLARSPFAADRVFFPFGSSIGLGGSSLPNG